MKSALLLTLLICCSFVGKAQQMTLSEWAEAAKTNIRLLPKYGYVQKTEAQKNADADLVKAMLESFTTRREASEVLIDEGFSNLYSDTKIAMYRFNQAYLLDSTNSDIYWGFGAVYLTIGDYKNARIQYQEGLKVDPKSTHLLTDYATYFMGQSRAFEMIDEESADTYMDSALLYMLQSYDLDPLDQNTLYKLSIIYLSMDDCENAWKYYDECVDTGGDPIEDGFTRELKRQCKR
ncbi:MAG: hypothetical protein QNK23_00435 [Crocinitomicaceae bacterium]|nr:hypothetical protein [Crocinitomicaceae bacterium]